MTIYENCDAWWSSLPAASKMWVHRYHYDITEPDKAALNADNFERDHHDFQMMDSGDSCGGADAGSTLTGSADDGTAVVDRRSAENIQVGDHVRFMAAGPYYPTGQAGGVVNEIIVSGGVHDRVLITYDDGSPGLVYMHEFMSPAPGDVRLTADWEIAGPVVDMELSK